MNFMSIRDAAKLLGVRTTSMYPLIWDRIITARKDSSGHWRVSRESAENYLKRRNQTIANAGAQ